MKYILPDLLWLPYGIGQTIIFLPCGFFFFLSLPNLSSWSTWCGLSANLECRSETCCTRLAENAGRKKSPKSRHLLTIIQLCRAISSQRRHPAPFIDNRKKNFLSSNISSSYPIVSDIAIFMLKRDVKLHPTSSCPHNMVNFGILAADNGPVVGAPQLISTTFASWQPYCTAVK